MSRSKCHGTFSYQVNNKKTRFSLLNRMIHFMVSSINLFFL